MMAKIYGVCPKRAAPHKGYHNVVQQLLDKEKGSTANAALWDDCFLNQKLYQYIAEPQDRHYESFVGQPSGDSLAFFRCRRLISPIAALTKKAAVLSLSSFTDSISCSTSCGTLTFTCFDLLFIEPVAISGLLGNRCDSVYAKKRAVQCLTCYSPSHKVNSTLSMSGYQNGNAPECWNTTEASNQTVN